MAEIRIGTSGWHYQHWRGPFYPVGLPASKMLAFYMCRFDAVEINNSFYRLPSPETLAAWGEATPPGFCFAVKASRFLTHNKKLKEPQNALQNLLPRLEVLREKLGPILFQLPPGWKSNSERLREFLSVLPARHRYAFEFREPSWISDSNLELLRRYNAAFCIYEIAGYHSPSVVTGNWAYVRLHGPGDKYQGSYPDRKLREWSKQIAVWNRQLRAIHIYFDNDQAAYAAQNALRLQELVREEIGRPTNVNRGRAA